MNKRQKKSPGNRSARRTQEKKTPTWQSDTIVVNGQAFAIIFPEE